MRILQCLQSSLINARASSTPPAHVASLKHVIICGTHALSNLCQSWETFCQELAAEDGQARKIRAKKLGRNWEDSDRILHHQALPYVPEIIKTELISRHHDDPPAGHFGIEKTQELVARKYYWETLHYDVEVYVRGCDICLTSKAVRYKPYRNLQQLPVPTHC